MDSGNSSLFLSAVNMAFGYYRHYAFIRIAAAILVVLTTVYFLLSSIPTPNFKKAARYDLINYYYRNKQNRLLLEDDRFYLSNEIPPAFLESDNFIAACRNFWQVNGCQSLLFSNRGDQHSWPSYLKEADDLLDLKQVLLVVTFNNPNYKAAAKTHALYHSMFADIFYCGPDDDVAAFWPPTIKNDSLTAMEGQTVFLPFGKQKYIWGETFYHCTTLANEKLKEMRKLEEKIKGVLFISDDVVLNVWTLKALGKRLDANWLMHDNEDHVFDVDTAKFCYGWRFKQAGFKKCDEMFDWRGAKDYAKNNQHFYDELVVKAGAGEPLWRDFHKDLERITGGKRRLLGNESADVYYIAKPYLDSASQLLTLFNKHRVFVEVAVVSVLKTITPADQLQLISAIGHDNGLGHLRDHAVEDVYTSRLEMMHPLKTGYLDLRSAKPASPGDRSSGCVYCNILRLTISYNQMLENYQK